MAPLWHGSGPASVLMITVLRDVRWHGQPHMESDHVPSHPMSPRSPLRGRRHCRKRPCAPTCRIVWQGDARCDSAHASAGFARRLVPPGPMWPSSQKCVAISKIIGTNSGGYHGSHRPGSIDRSASDRLRSDPACHSEGRARNRHPPPPVRQEAVMKPSKLSAMRRARRWILQELTGAKQ
jgi:hypothetical protein